MNKTITETQIDFIGDIHGHADKLEWLLCKLGYQKLDGIYRHPERKILFLGDFIDRGPDNSRVVSIARRMVENGTAYAILGNHEYNAVLFNLRSDTGYLRPHTIKNFKQHSSTLLQYHGKQAQYDEDIKWFKSLPIYIETDGFRAVHAAWDQSSINTLKNISNNGLLNDEMWRQSAQPTELSFDAVEKVCKGIEMPLPKGVSFHDKDGTERYDIRVKWWENPLGKSYEDMSVVDGLQINNTAFETELDYYKEAEKPVFFGHYWMKGTPTLQKPNVCCLDFSVAKGGYLCAYRWDGEQRLLNNKLVFV